MPKSALVDLPSWLWGGEVPGFLRSAGLQWTLAGKGTGRFQVRAIERGRRDRSQVRLVDSADLFTLSASDRRAVLANVEAAAPGEVLAGNTKLAAEVARLNQKAEAAGRAGYVAPTLGAIQLSTVAAHTDELHTVIEQAVAHMRSNALTITETGAPLFPHASAHVVVRARGLVTRSRLPTVLIRLANDEQLRRGDLSHAQADLESGKLIFASSGSLSDGLFLADVYLAPLLGALMPFVWAFPAVRASSIVLFTLGRAIPSSAGHPVEPAHLIRGRTTGTTASAPTVSAEGMSHAITWWARRLDRLLGVVTDPAVHTDSAGQYVPLKSLQALASVEQLFRRTAAIQRGHRDDDSRRALLFGTLDTFERVGSRRLLEMCTLSEAQRVLENLRQAIPADAAQILLPAAELAVAALAAVQDGFFMDQHTPIRYEAPDGTVVTLGREEAAAHYIKLLRNATHGYGSNQPDAIARTNTLLTHHNGDIPYDLPELGYLYLLDMLTNPEKLRRALWASARS